MEPNERVILGLDLGTPEGSSTVLVVHHQDGTTERIQLLTPPEGHIDREAVFGALAKATGLSNGWWRDWQHEKACGSSSATGSNEWLYYGRAQGAAQAAAVICAHLQMRHPPGLHTTPGGSMCPPSPPPPPRHQLVRKGVPAWLAGPLLALMFLAFVAPVLVGLVRGP